MSEEKRRTRKGVHDMGSLVVGLEDELAETVNRSDRQNLQRTYWSQNEFIHLEHFLPSAVSAPLLEEVELLQSDINRNYVPGHKQGGSVSFYSIREKAPAMLGLYKSQELRTFLGQITDAELKLCPEDDPHACALYYYTKPGDHIGYHYDTSYYKGARYTVLIGLVEQSKHCRLVARVGKHEAVENLPETSLPMNTGTMVIFNGDKLWHAVTPLGEGERRVVLTLQYVTDQRMGPVKKLFSNMKDAVAYFGPAALFRRPKVHQGINRCGVSMSNARIE